jgi:hypothetical protein
MSNLYGVVDGSASTPATRRGHTELTTTAASWAGAIRVCIKRGSDGTERFEISMVPWHGNGDMRILATGIPGDAASVRFQPC